jgi:putative NIF3 family GTP cyclohydrolase 1 type 2
MGIHFIAAGHHATERFGVKSMAAFLSEECGLDSVFIDIDNPA